MSYTRKSYTCHNTECSAPENRKGKMYPSAMECPFCDVDLVEVVSFSEADTELINSLPYVIAYPLQRTLIESNPWTKINLLKDTFLNYLKYLGLLTASEFFNSEIKDKGMVALFHKNLMETAFGKWNHYLRECLLFLKQQNHTFFYPELLAYYELVETGPKSKKYKGEIEYQDGNGDTQYIVQTSVTGIGMLINFRNRYLGHGQTWNEDKSKELWNEYFPIFRQLLEQLSFTKDYPMLKREHGETYLLHSSEIRTVESNVVSDSNVWIQNKQGQSFNILPFFIVPGEVSLAKEDKEQLFTYESYTGKTIKFFSPEGSEKQTSGKILEKLNLLLRDKQKETPFTPEDFTKEEFLKRIAEENKLLLDTLIAEKKLIPGVYQHREEIEIKLREWIGARASIFFIVAEAGSGKTNLLVEIQKQYAEHELPSLLIRAGRMEKQSLQKQIAYLLNIDLEEGLENYTSISGTQEESTFILIDGLNEANNAEEIWQEIIDLSKIFETGSLKFVVTNRANTKAELNRYVVSELDQDLLYGESKQNETGLGAYSFWLTALDMKEMKGAWENYTAKDKAKFKPQFNFDAIAEFDRGLYNQINNPLILRLFLEIYNGKVLPKKGLKHLNIWQDWFSTFSAEEQIFLKLIANEVWQKGENELLLDDLLKHETLKPYFTSDIINAPYNRLKNNGWISRYVKDLNGYVGFTVEASLLYLIALQLKEQTPPIDLAAVKTISKTHSKLQKSAIEVFLCEQALNGELNLVADLIDAGNDCIDISTKPLLLYLKMHGVNFTIEKVLENSTENDWLALNKLDNQLEELQLHVLRKEYLEAIMPRNEFRAKDALEIGLRSIALFDKEEALHYLEKIDTRTTLFSGDADLLSQLGICEYSFGNYNDALKYFKLSLKIRLKEFGSDHHCIATIYDYIGVTLQDKEDYSKALEYHKLSLEIRKKILGPGHPDLAHVYNNIGAVWVGREKYEKALECYQMSLEIRLKTWGGRHLSVAHSYNNIGATWHSKKEYDKALEYYLMSLDIRLMALGEGHRDLSISLNNIAMVWHDKNEYDKAIEYFQMGLEIDLKTLGGNHPNLATTYNNIACVWHDKEEYEKALKYYQMCLEIRLKALGEENSSVGYTYNNIGVTYDIKGEHAKALGYYRKCLSICLKNINGNHPFLAKIFHRIGKCEEAVENHIDALSFFIKSLEIWRDNSELIIDGVSLITSIDNTKRIARELRKEIELPQWLL